MTRAHGVPSALLFEFSDLKWMRLRTKSDLPIACSLRFGTRTASRATQS